MKQLYVVKSADTCANLYYRVELPTRVSKKLGLSDYYAEDHSTWGMKPDAMRLIEHMVHADYHLYYGGPSKMIKERVNFLLGVKPGHSQPYNQIRTRPGVFWTLDDDFHHLNPLNQAYLWNGYKTPDGKLLGRGDSVGIKLPTGEDVTLWEYGKEYFGAERFFPERNRKSIREMDEFLGKVDGVYFTTKRLAEAYAPWVKNRFVFPNCIYFPDWNIFPEQQNVREDPEEVRVLWQGGASHFGDLMSVQPAMAELTRKYPKLRWLMWGADFPAVHRVIPDEQLRMIPWISYAGYRPVLETIDFDFAIAPLVPTPFNDGKSSIKVYEPAALRHPKPTLAAACPPYSDDLVDGETALLYQPGNVKEFSEKFSALVEDKELRSKVAHRCQEWLRDERDVEAWTKKLFQWMADTRGTGYAMANEVGALINDLVSRGAFNKDSKLARTVAERL